MKKIYYIARVTLPSTRANSVHVAKITEAFSELGGCTLILPKPEEIPEKDEIFIYYGLKTDFSIKYIEKKFSNFLWTYHFAWNAVKVVNPNNSIVITRDPLTAFFAVMKGIESVLDLHGDLRHLCGRAYRMIKWNKFVLNSKLHIVTISEGLKKYYIDTYNVPYSRITVLHDGVTLKNFKNSTSLCNNAPSVLKIGFCGSFYKGKGLELVYKLSRIDKTNMYYLIGGDKEKAEKEVAGVFGENVVFKGYIENARIPQELDKMDILLLPNQNKQNGIGEDIGMFTSPLKMFEYMATGKVIIASNLHVLCEVLNEKNSIIVSPTDEYEWLNAIDHVSKNWDEARRKAVQAKEDVREYTWINRAEKMLQLCNEEIK